MFSPPDRVGAGHRPVGAARDHQRPISWAYAVICSATMAYPFTARVHSPGCERNPSGRSAKGRPTPVMDDRRYERPARALEPRQYLRGGTSAVVHKSDIATRCLSGRPLSDPLAEPPVRGGLSARHSLMVNSAGRHGLITPAQIFRVLRGHRAPTCALILP